MERNVRADLLSWIFRDDLFSDGLQWTKCNLLQQMHCGFGDVSERVVLFSRYKIDVKENITL